LDSTFRLQYGMHHPGLSFTAGDDCILCNQNIFESDQGRIDIGDRVFISANTKLISRSLIKIGNDVLISWGCTIYDHDAHSFDYRNRIADHQNHLLGWEADNLLLDKDWTDVKSKPITIEDHVWLGFDVVVLKGVTIGEGAIVGARSVVTSDVPPWTIVAGCPARVVKEIPMNMRPVNWDSK